VGTPERLQPRPVEWVDEAVLEAYPNPTTGPVYLVYRTPVDDGQLNLTVVDANGREVYHGTRDVGAGIVELSTTGWPAGLYVVELSAEDLEPMRVKLSVQR
jgi:hypothetical protein